MIIHLLRLGIALLSRALETPIFLALFHSPSLSLSPFVAVDRAKIKVIYASIHGKFLAVLAK